MAISSSFLPDVSRADATAALVARLEATLGSSNVPFDTKPLICDRVQQLVTALERGEVDGVVVQFSEYALIPPRLLERDFIYVNQPQSGLLDSYLLLVRQDSGIESIQQLEGRHLIRWDHPRASLAPQWLDILLAGSRKRLVEESLGSLDKATKVTKVVLPVFFRQADACIITQSGFEEMSELNPQVGQQLRVLARSPEVVASFFSFRAGYKPRFRPRIEAAIDSLHTTAAGKQVLMAFGCERATRAPISCLGNSWRLMDEWLRVTLGASPSPSSLSNRRVSRTQDP